MATKKTNPAAPQKQGDLAIQERTSTEKPRKYVVVFHNDDYTTQEFVVHVLMKFFHKDVTEATHVMLHVHLRGWGAVGVFTRDVAESKVEQVMAYAKQGGHPLRVTAEPEGFEG
jgi:ATP-dependent Clp protease adaptor protein ClpS